MNLIPEHLQEQEPRLVVWITFSDELSEHAASGFEKAWYQLGNRRWMFSGFWGNRDYHLAVGMASWLLG